MNYTRSYVLAECLDTIFKTTKKFINCLISASDKHSVRYKKGLPFVLTFAFLSTICSVDLILTIISFLQNDKMKTSYE